MTFRKFIVIVLCLLVTICASGQDVFVSSSRGSDDNDGISPQTPFRTLEKAFASGRNVFLKAGDIFYGPVECYGRKLSRYGEGPNPLVSGYKRIHGQRWRKVAKNVWRLDLTGRKFSGAGVSDASSLLNNIGCIHDWKKDEIHGKKVRRYNELKEDWDIWQVDTSYAEMPPSSFNYLYLFLKRNPNRLNLEFSVGAVAMYIQDSTVDGVDFEGFGFGISGGSGTVLRNCRVDAMGGMLQLGYPEFICYGNGIEFYVSRNLENSLVEHCRVSRCYDAGMTLQGSDCPGAFPKNIVFRNNLILNCCQGWEDYLRNGEDARFDNCRFENNLVMGSGNSGFGYADGRFKYCNILGNNFEGNRGMVIRGNVFVGGNFYCTMPYRGKYASHCWEGNVYYMTPGSFILANYVGTEDVLIPKAAGKDDMIARYRSLTGDRDTRFISCTSEEIFQIQNDYLQLWESGNWPMRNESTPYHN